MDASRELPLQRRVHGVDPGGVRAHAGGVSAAGGFAIVSRRTRVRAGQPVLQRRQHPLSLSLHSLILRFFSIF